jgi:hypothetical protein
MLITDPQKIISLIDYAFSGQKDCPLTYIDRQDSQTLYPDIETSFIRSGFTVYCLIKGTEPQNVMDIITDLHFAKTPHPYTGWGKVHSGFLSSSQGIALCFAIWFKKFGDGATHCVFAGHSLGAALSLLTPSLTLPLLGILADNYHVVGVGSPRVGDADFCTLYNATFNKDQIVSYIIDRDPVPHMPPSIFGFQRPGRDVIIKPTKSFFSHPLKNYKEALNV